jgi:hypothetical protein
MYITIPGNTDSRTVGCGWYDGDAVLRYTCSGLKFDGNFTFSESI